MTTEHTSTEDAQAEPRAGTCRLGKQCQRLGRHCDGCCPARPRARNGESHECWATDEVEHLTRDLEVAQRASRMIADAHKKDAAEVLSLRAELEAARQEIAELTNELGVNGRVAFVPDGIDEAWWRGNEVGQAMLEQNVQLRNQRNDARARLATAREVVRLARSFTFDDNMADALAAFDAATTGQEQP
jgi:hypothetical protein